jgi:DNA invertase Pin-like site-specific DNA recombinase
MTGAKSAQSGSTHTSPDDAVVLYVRVSTTEQDLEGQERELVSAALRMGWTVVEVFREKASATGRAERREYERLLREASKPGRAWRHLLVWSLDRFSRAETFTKATQTILDLERLGIRFHSLKEPMLDTPSDGQPNLGRDVLLALLPVIASFESKRKSERVRLAMKEIKEGRRRTRSGKPPGRPRRLTPEKIQAVVAYRAQGLAWAVVAQKVGLPSGTCRYAASMERRKMRANEHGSPGQP